MENLAYQRLENRRDTQSCPPQFKSNYTPYALTEENVSKVLLADPSSMPLARYCSELECSTIYSSSSNSSQHQSRCTATDSVIESPRVLPFPYHNDSYFLPTAEHDYPGGSANDTSSMISFSVGSRQANFRSTGKCSMDSAHRRHLLTARSEKNNAKNRNLNSFNSNNNNVIPKCSTPLRSRRNSFKSSSSTQDQKKYRLRLTPKDFFFSRNNTPLRNISYCSTITSSTSETYAEELEQVAGEKNSVDMVPWYKKVLKLFNKSRRVNKMSDRANALHPKSTTIIFN